eukprot:Hpha_TRINITY_DN8271_c0_g1::TRINITY_DN8271_c0_g1_i1::g.111986::m.111986
MKPWGVALLLPLCGVLVGSATASAPIEKGTPSPAAAVATSDNRGQDNRGQDNRGQDNRGQDNRSQEKDTQAPAPVVAPPPLGAATTDSRKTPPTTPAPHPDTPVSQPETVVSQPKVAVSTGAVPEPTAKVESGEARVVSEGNAPTASAVANATLPPNPSTQPPFITEQVIPSPLDTQQGHRPAKPPPPPPPSHSTPSRSPVKNVTVEENDDEEPMLWTVAKDTPLRVRPSQRSEVQKVARIGQLFLARGIEGGYTFLEAIDGTARGWLKQRLLVPSGPANATRPLGSPTTPSQHSNKNDNTQQLEAAHLRGTHGQLRGSNKEEWAPGSKVFVAGRLGTLQRKYDGRHGMLSGDWWVELESTGKRELVPAHEIHLTNATASPADVGASAEPAMASDDETSNMRSTFAVCSRDVQFSSNRQGNVNLESHYRLTLLADECSRQCARTKGCACFTWNGRNSRCWLMGQCNTPEAKKGFISGHPSCRVPPRPFGDNRDNDVQALARAPPVVRGNIALWELPVINPKGAPPEMLMVAVPPDSRLKGLAGVYVLATKDSPLGPLKNGLPYWRRDTGKGWIFSHARHAMARWVVCVEQKHFHRNAGFLRTSDSHDGRWPQDVADWDSFDSRWLPNRAVTITKMPRATGRQHDSTSALRGALRGQASRESSNVVSSSGSDRSTLKETLKLKRQLAVTPVPVQRASAQQRQNDGGEEELMNHQSLGLLNHEKLEQNTLEI